MTTINTESRHFYQHLGKLFYAVAVADNHVDDIEFEKLKYYVKKYWLKTDTNVDGVTQSEVYQIELMFEKLKNDERNGDQCYSEFIAYFKEHSTLFSKDIKKRIMKTAGAIAYAFAGINKSELILLAKLNLELKKQIS